MLRSSFAATAVAARNTPTAFAHNNGGGNNGGNNGGNVGGIRIDGGGVVSLAMQQDRAGKLDAKRKQALLAQAAPGAISRPSDFRCVSLVTLEQRCTELLEARQPLPNEIKCLGGLTRLDFVFVDPDGRDLIIAGPAEPFAQAESGRWLGLESGRPVLLLDDLLIALRTVNLTNTVGCSIDPTAERLANLQQFLRQNSFPATAEVVQQRFGRMREVLGNHTVRIDGVPADSHFARGLVEADFRMKVLALGLENPGVKGFRSHLAMVKGGNAIQRWWFVPLYDAIHRSADGLSYEFAGQRAQLLGEDELANAAGARSKSAITKISTEAFSKQFTDKFPQLAEKMPVFAGLQQLIDWVVFAALLRQDRIAERIDWAMPVFADEQQLPHETWPTPKETECLLNTKRTGGGLILGQLSGGVTIRPGEVLRQISGRAEETAGLPSRRAQALQRASGEEHPWWWD
jgi:hypothetical protein